MTTEVRSVFLEVLNQTIDNLTDVHTLALVPRNTIGRLNRFQISIILLSGLAANHALEFLLIPWRIPGTGLPTIAPTPLTPLWSGNVGVAITGTPADTHVVRPTVNESVNFSQIKRRGVGVRSKGTRSNNRAGWSIMVIDRDNQATTYQLQVAAEVNMEWIGGSGSRKNLDIAYGDFDENENQ